MMRLRAARVPDHRAAIETPCRGLYTRHHRHLQTRVRTMTASSQGESITELLHRWRSGEQAALDALFPQVYAELHRTMRKWTADWVDTMKLPPGISRDDYVTILLATIIGVHQQWQIAHDEIDLGQTLDAFKALLINAQRK